MQLERAQVSEKVGAKDRRRFSSTSFSQANRRFSNVV
jgi:hypothetical protein